MIRSLLITLILLYTNSSFAAEGGQDNGLLKPILHVAKHHWLTVYPGLSIKSPTIDIKRKSDGQAASVTDSPGVFALSMSLKMKDFDIPDTKWGFTFFGYSSYFTAGEQFAGVDGADVIIVDLGTSLSGYYVYFVPAIYFKDPRTTTDEAELKLGFGYGQGTANFEGAAVFGPDRRVSSGDPKTSVKASATDVFAFTVFYSLEWKNRTNFRVAITTLSFDDADYEFDLTEFSIILSRTFSLF